MTANEANTDTAIALANLANTLAQFPEVVDRIVTGAVSPKAPSVYDARQIQLPLDGSPILLLPYNAARILFRVKLVDPTTTDVYIGPLSTLSSGTGYGVTGAAEDLHTVSEVYAAYISAEPVTTPVYVSLWAEYALE